MRKLYLAGQWIDTGKYMDVVFEYTGETVDTVSIASASHVDEAIAKAHASLERTRKLEPYQKATILRYIIQELRVQKESFAQMLVLENGKTIREARTEMERCITTFEIAAGESERITGEYMDLAINPLSTRRHAIVRKFPIGVISAITPFNFPMNLVAHKLAPAIATGCPIVVKPASATPITTLMLAEIIEASGWPKEALSVLPCDRVVGQQLVEDERISLLSFTGSPTVGWQMKERIGKKKVVLELGGNAGVIVDRDVDNWKWLIDRMAIGAFYQAGQSCISVQRIYVHADIYEEFRTKFVEKIQSMKVGDPREESTDIAGLIDRKNRERLGKWITEAIENGATCLAGNTGDGIILSPTLLENVPDSATLAHEEAFGPVAILYKFTDFSDAIRRVNDSKFGLQVGVFTKNIDRIWQLFEEAEVGWVIQNDVPSFRVDSMPYGGLKDSGLGREGIKYAMDDMLEEKVLVLKV